MSLLKTATFSIYGRRTRRSLIEDTFSPVVKQIDVYDGRGNIVQRIIKDTSKTRGFDAQKKEPGKQAVTTTSDRTFGTYTKEIIDFNLLV